jgi:hypothetical protein
MSFGKGNVHARARDQYKALDSGLALREVGTYTNIEAAIAKATQNVASLASASINGPA